METIYALSSGSLPSGVAVIRLSGPRAGDCLAALCGALPSPRQATLRTFRRPSDGVDLDQGLALWFPGPASFTGEDAAEIHVHGGRAVIAAILEALAAAGARSAEPGEFARRAFGNGKLDLTRVEGLSDLIAAETEVQRRQAFGQAGGRLADRAEHWRESLLNLRAGLEARLDFADEGDVPEALPPEFWAGFDQLRSDMEETLRGAERGERVRDGLRVAIMGRPNAGKSSLLNALARRDVAIVADEPGTTRDIVEVALNLEGCPVLLFDTAGIREASSAVEREGVRRAKAAGKSADLVLWLQEAGGEADPVPIDGEATIWRVRSKVDLAGPGRTGGLGVSVVSGAGLDDLIACLAKTARESMGGGAALITRQRQKEAVADAVAALGAAPGQPDEIAADLLRSATEAIGRLTGRVDVEAVLDRLFAEFCIGK